MIKLKREDYIKLTIEITKNQNQDLKEHTKKNGQTKSGAVRVAIDRYLEAERRKEK